METTTFKTKLKIYLSSLILAVILLVSISFGMTAGQKLAEAEQNDSTAKNIAVGLKYFYADQNRFPTVDEFNDKATMLNYFTNFPPTELASGICSQSFVYKRDDSQNYELDYCLPASLKGEVAGWNSLNQNSD